MVLTEIEALMIHQMHVRQTAENVAEKHSAQTPCLLMPVVVNNALDQIIIMLDIITRHHPYGLHRSCTFEKE